MADEVQSGSKNKRSGAGKRLQLQKDMAWLRKNLDRERAASRKAILQKAVLAPMRCRAFAWVIRCTQGFKCGQCKVIDGLDEMGPQVWAVNWDHHRVSREAAQIQYPKPNLNANP